MISPQNPQYRSALAAPHAAYSRVEVWRGGVKVEELNATDPTVTRGAPVFLGGSIRATLESRVARTLTMTVPEWLYPYRSTDLLNPYGTQLRCFRGLRYGSGTVDEFPTFVGPIISVKPDGRGTATVNASDLAGEVISADFPGPAVAQVGTAVVSEFKRLVSDALPSATYGAFSAIGTLVPELSYDSDRGAALDGLAAAAGAFWYPLADGRFVMRFIPWTVPLAQQPLPMASGDEATGLGYAWGGTIVSAFPNRTREGIANQVTVTSERADGGVPFWATVADTDTASPTYINGPFGVKSRTVRISQAPNQGSAYAAAQAILARSKARTESWSITCIPDGSLELGDALRLFYRGHDVTQLIAGFTMPLEPSGTMSVDCRDLISNSTGVVGD